jgi:hypothetical protein
MRRQFRPAGQLVAMAATAVCCALANAQQGAVTSEVLGRIDSPRSSTGDSFFVRTTTAWTEGRCAIPSGMMLEGRIAKVQRKGSGTKREQMDLGFLPIPCSGDEAQQIIPILVAMQSPHADPREGFIDQQQLSAALAANLKRAPQANGPNSSTRTPAPPGSVGGSVGALGNLSPSSASRQPFHVAEATGFPGVKITLPVLTSDPTALSSPGPVLIDPGTRFRLVLQLEPRPAPPDHPAEERAAIGIPPAEPKPPPVKEDVEMESCVETGCAFADSSPAISSSPIERTLSLHAFGFRARENRVLRALAEDATVSFLGNDQLLITFNPHPLILRSQEEFTHLASPRIIRALLFSSTGKIIRAQDWRVPGGGAYLWPLDHGRVLVHVGGTLVVYGPRLAVERQWTLPGELRFLRVSPSRNLILAVVVHERHTPEQHRRLVEFVGPDHPIDEDFELTLLNGQLQVENTRLLQTWPTLSEVLDTGLVLTQRGLAERWTVGESTWEGKQQQITHMSSGCPLHVETLPTNLILILGCSPDNSRTWYKVVRASGKTLLNGNVPQDGLLEHAEASADAAVFAIGIGEATHPVDFTQGFVASDLQSIAVSVYRIADGHRIFATRSRNSAINRQSFALNPSGNRLAILSGDKVSVYRIDKPEHPGSEHASH